MFVIRLFWVSDDGQILLVSLLLLSSGSVLILSLIMRVCHLLFMKAICQFHFTS